MRIEAYTQVQQIYGKKPVTKAQQANATSFSDQLQISSKGKDIQLAKQAVGNAPDVREEVTAPLKTSIQNGTYQVSSSAFAEKLLASYNPTQN